MGLLTWIVLGAISGWIASIIVKTNRSQGLLMDIVLGVIGAFVGGFVMNFFGQAGVSGLNLYSIVVSVFGAVLVIAIGRKLT